MRKHQWSVRKTAEVLGRSVGGISEDLRLSLALRVYPEVDEFRRKTDALEYLRDKGKIRIYTGHTWSDKEIQAIIETLKEQLKEEE